MRYKLNPELINPVQIQVVRNELAVTMRLDKWLPASSQEIKSKILDIMAETAVESASMLQVPTAEFRVVREPGWKQIRKFAEASTIMEQQGKKGKDHIYIGEWFIKELAGRLQGSLWYKTTVRELRDMVAHEQYHVRESRATPRRYKREMKKGVSYRKSFSELAADLFAEYYVSLKH